MIYYYIMYFLSKKEMAISPQKYNFKYQTRSYNLYCPIDAGFRDGLAETLPGKGGDGLGKKCECDFNGNSGSGGAGGHVGAAWYEFG